MRLRKLAFCGLSKYGLRGCRVRESSNPGPGVKRRRRVESSSPHSESDFSDLLDRKISAWAPTDADVATTQLSSTMPASAAILFSASTVPASSRALREVHRGRSPSVTQTPTTLPGVRASAGEAHDLGHGAIIRWAISRSRSECRGPHCGDSDMSFNDSDEEDVAGSLAGNRFAVLSDNRSVHAELEVPVPVRPRRRLVLVSQDPDVEVSDHEWDPDTDSIGGASDVEVVDVRAPTVPEPPPLSWSPGSGHLPVLTQSTSSKCSTSGHE